MPRKRADPLDTEERFDALIDYFKRVLPYGTEKERKKWIKTLLNDCITFNPNHHMFVEAWLAALAETRKTYPELRSRVEFDADYITTYFQQHNQHTARQSHITNTDFLIPLLAALHQ